MSDNPGPNCYECRYRIPILGDAHSGCNHPITEELGLDAMQTSIDMPRMLASVKEKPKAVGFETVGKTEFPLMVTFDTHGVLMGWGYWPWNFDPVWLLSCNGFEKSDDSETHGQGTQ